jgi:hypothetical protein
MAARPAFVLPDPSRDRLAVEVADHENWPLHQPKDQP